jgi:tetratricopeptide (TPR) repeat protein
MKKKYKIALATIVAISAVAYVTRDTPKEKEAKYLRRGNAFFEKGEFLKARIEYKNAVKIIPTDPEIAYRWGLVDEAEGDIRKAFMNFLAAEQQNPHYAPALKKLAHYLLAGNQKEMALTRIDTLIADSPEDPESRALKGAIHLRNQEYARAEKEARFALSKDPANITASSVLTGIYLAQKDFPKAVEALEEGIKQNPKDISLLMLKASIYETPFNAAKIKETYDAVFLLKPTEPQFRLMLTQVYVNAKMLKEAEETLRAGVAAIPENWQIKQVLINFLDQYRSKEVAEKELLEYIKKYPDNSDLTLWLANLYVSHDDTEKAIAILQKVIDKDEDNKQSLNAKTSIARISFIKGNKELAESIVNAVLKKSPSNRDALFIRANFEVERGLYENAVIDLRSIIRDNAKSQDALKLLSEVLLQQGYVDLAIETLNQLVDLDPVNPENRTRLAQLYGINNDTKRSMDQLKIVTTANPDYPIGWESVARISIAAKDFEAAKSAIEKLRALKGQEATATYLEAQIAEANNKHDEAITLYKKVIDADPKTPIAERALFALLASHRKPDDIEKLTIYLASLKTDSPYVYTLLGEGYMQLGKKDLAVAALDTAISNHPISHDPYLDKAKIALSNQKVDEAIEILKQATVEVPSDLRASLLHASILSNEKKYKEAIEIYENVLRLKPQFAVAANNMAAIISDQFYKDSEMLEKAKIAIDRFTGTKDPLMLDTIGWLYYRLDKIEQSSKFLAKAVATDEKIPAEINYHYGVVLLKTGNKAQAKVELTKAVAAGAEYPALEEAKKLLAGI